MYAYQTDHLWFSNILLNICLCNHFVTSIYVSNSTEKYNHNVHACLVIKPQIFVQICIYIYNLKNGNTYNEQFTFNVSYIFASYIYSVVFFVHFWYKFSTNKNPQSSRLRMIYVTYSFTVLVYVHICWHAFNVMND